MKYKLDIAGITDKGKKRAKNEDNLIVNPELGLMAVADGMGGHSAGDLASRLATQIFEDQIKRSLQTGHVPVFSHVPANQDLDPKTLILGDCIKFANQAVHEAAQSDVSVHNMGTTFVAALCLDDKLAVGHVGDSRLYVARKGILTQATHDHSFVQEQVDQGLLKPEEAEKSDLRNMLTRSVGISEEVDVDLMELALQKGDLIMLCSDGLTKMVDDRKIQDSFKVERPPQAIAQELVDKAIAAGGADNITVIVAKVIESPSGWGSLADRVKKLMKKRG